MARKGPPQGVRQRCPYGCGRFLTMTEIAYHLQVCPKAPKKGK